YPHPQSPSLLTPSPLHPLRSPAPRDSASRSPQSIARLGGPLPCTPIRPSPCHWPTPPAPHCSTHLPANLLIRRSRSLSSETPLALRSNSSAPPPPPRSPKPPPPRYTPARPASRLPLAPSLCPDPGPERPLSVWRSSGDCRHLSRPLGRYSRQVRGSLMSATGTGRSLHRSWRRRAH